MKIQMIKTNSFILMFLVGFLFFSSCEADKWIEHYQENSSIVSKTNLWETISTSPNLKKFTWSLKKTGYDKLLSTSQMMTVWAPVDSASDNIDTADVHITADRLLKEYVQNHVARFSHSATGNQNVKVMMQNDKLLSFVGQNNDFSIASVKLKGVNRIASNGILHIVEHRIPFVGSVWETLTTEPNLDSIAHYLHSFDKIMFDEANSIQGSPDSTGRMVYLDSVMVNYNPLFWQIGMINNEDSTYSAIVPTNEAWNKAVSSMNSFFRYSPKLLTQYAADTLQAKYARRAIVQDLVFSHTNQNMSNDTLISTNKNKIYHPFDGYSKLLNVSNGNLYVTDNLHYNSWDSWHKEIRVEAENQITGAESGIKVDYKIYPGSDTMSVSNSRYLQVESTSNANPTIYFDFPNTLSGKFDADSTLLGAAYNVYCVFLPNSLISKPGKKPLPNKVVFSIYYGNDSGKSESKPFATERITSATKLTKVLVASNWVFPYSEYGLKKPNVLAKIRVTGKVSNEESDMIYTRNMLIDCIILEPVKR